MSIEIEASICTEGSYFWVEAKTFVEHLTARELVELYNAINVEDFIAHHDLRLEGESTE